MINHYNNLPPNTEIKLYLTSGIEVIGTYKDFWVISGEEYVELFTYDPPSLTMYNVKNIRSCSIEYLCKN